MSFRMRNRRRSKSPTADVASRMKNLTTKDKSTFRHRRLDTEVVNQVKDQLVDDGEMWECLDCGNSENYDRDKFCTKCRSPNMHTEWACDVCTLLNKPEFLQCEACSAVRPVAEEESDIVFRPRKKIERGITLLWSSYAGSKNHGGDRSDTDRIVQMLEAYGWPQEAYERVNGGMPEDRLRRDQLFEISKRRGVYPQVFLDGRFLGTFKEVEEMNEQSKLKPLLDEARAKIVLRV